MRILISFVAVSMLAARPCAQGAAWIVDAAGGPGSDFTDLQVAVDSVAEGDTLIVREGTYAPFEISGMSLQVVAEEGASPLVSPEMVLPAFTPLSIRDLAPSQRVLVRGLSLQSGFFSGPLPLRISDCLGEVWIEDVRTEDTAFGQSVLAGVEIRGSTATYFVRVEIASGQLSAPGIRAFEGSKVTIYDSQVLGSPGGFGFAWGDGTKGGSGLLVEDSTVFVSGSSLQGGPGGGSLATGGEGGPGVRVTGSESILILLDSSTIPGSGGVGAQGVGADGVPREILDGATFLELMEGARSYQISSPIPAGGSADLEFLGEPGDLFVLWYAQSFSGIYIPEFTGVLLPGLDGQLFVVGSADPAGALEVSLPVGSLPLGVGATTYRTQGIVATAQAAITLSAGSAVTIIE